jgi:hypothetical protein
MAAETELGRGTRGSDLRTSEALLDNRTPFQLEFTENIAGGPLTLSKNVLALRPKPNKSATRGNKPC